MYKKSLFLLLLIIGYRYTAFASILPDKEEINYVDPFIGTDDAKAYTKWGKEGGTYPGAVAPWGYIQISPETGGGQSGYHYADSSIQYFSCIGHKSGFPEGSKGNIQLMPISKGGNRLRSFRHSDEQAKPGYYRITFQDDKTLVECTATARVGIIKITFPAGVAPRLWIADVGALQFKSDNTAYGTRHGSAFQFSLAVTKQESKEGNNTLHFNGNRTSPTVLTVLVSASPLGYAAALKNIMALLQEARKAKGVPFSYVLQQTRKEWSALMQTISINDANEHHKRSFYTALYHACLLPWVISDVDGFYKGADGLTHQTNRNSQYGSFSPWDTFRTLHPLIQLLWPQRQVEMVGSMLDVYKQSGFLPTESMTGNHAVPILVDSYLKNPMTANAKEIYEALKGSIYQAPFKQPDLAVYHEKGFIPATMGESVTRTMEYAYDDWALANFAEKVMQDTAVATITKRCSRAYRQLFKQDELFFIPKDEAGWKNQPGTFGYKEGDTYIYSYFVPQYPRDLINLMGDDSLFSSRLNHFLSGQQLVFDNEPAFHVPYLFLYARRPDLTQYWVHRILTDRFSDTPGGLPGNDDLGSLSSWYIFNALGFYPIAPGKPIYTLGTPLFDEVTIHLPNKKILSIQKDAIKESGYYLQAVQLNGKPYSKFEVDHQTLISGALLKFTLGEKANSTWNQLADVITADAGKPSVRLNKVEVLKNKVNPDEPIPVMAQLHNKGARSTKQLEVKLDGKTYTHKNVLIEEGETRQDTLFVRVYPFGEHQLTLDDHHLMIHVTPSVHQRATPLEVSQLSYAPLVRLGADQRLHYKVKNLDGAPKKIQLPIQLSGQEIGIDTLTLQPGEEQQRVWVFQTDEKGQKTITIADQQGKYLVYDQALEALLFGGPNLEVGSNGLLIDKTPFANEASVKGLAFSPKDQLFTLDSQRYVSWKENRIVDAIDTRMTITLWIKAQAPAAGLVDIFSKGDQHVLQLVDGKKLNFFAGGWGRGECTTELPADWYGKWHHVAGVCDGKNLYLYIDGVLKERLAVAPDVSLANNNRWQLGQNEEFPGERIYQGLAKKVMVFAESLSSAEIAQVADGERHD